MRPVFNPHILTSFTVFGFSWYWFLSALGFYSALFSCNQPPAIDEGEYEYQRTILSVPQAMTTDRIFGIQWRQISGPAPANILCPTCISTEVTGLQLGVYEFELALTNEHGTGRDTTKRFVMAEPLNVELLEFRAFARPQHNLVTWLADTSEPVVFELYRNAEFIYKATACKVQYKDYGFTPVSHYQLKQTNQQGRVRFSEIITIRNTPTENKLIAVFQDQLYITFTSTHRQRAIIAVYNSAGAQVAGKELIAEPGPNRFSLPVNGAAGIYIIRCSTPSLNLTTRVVK